MLGRPLTNSVVKDPLCCSENASLYNKSVGSDTLSDEICFIDLCEGTCLPHLALWAMRATDFQV